MADDAHPFPSHRDPDIADEVMVGRGVRLTIPLRDRYALRRTADILRGYAARMEALSHNLELHADLLMLTVRMLTTETNEKIREQRRTRNTTSGNNL